MANSGIGEFFQHSRGDDELNLILSRIRERLANIEESGRVEPTGVIKAYGGSTAPSGYLLCDGASYLRDKYPDLFKIIGTKYGATDRTHFNVPDLVGKYLKGAPTSTSQGEEGGSASVTLSHSGAAVADHAAKSTDSPSGTTKFTFNASGTEAASSSHTHTISAYTHSVTQPGNHTVAMDPLYVTVNYIIKT